MKKIIIKEHTIIEDFLLNKNLRVVDLGACRGEFIRGISEKFPIDKAILVEPNVTNYSQLLFDDNYIILNKAVTGNKCDSIIFKEDINSPYNGSLYFDYFSNIKEYKVDTITLSEIIQLFGNFEYIDILKIDIEGSEYDVLTETDDETLLKFRQISVEFHDFLDSSLAEKNRIIEERMLNLGFSIEKNGTDYLLKSEYYDTLFYR